MEIKKKLKHAKNFLFSWMHYIILRIIAKLNPSYLKKIMISADLTEIGFTGYGPTAFDKLKIEKMKIQKLTWFQMWLLRYEIASEKAKRQNRFKIACSNVIGEYPY